MSEITKILERMGKGESGADQALLREVYDELRRIASAKMRRENPGQTLQPTALVHEAWLKLAGHGVPQFENRRHFFGAAGEAMRRILVDRARRRRRVRHGGEMQAVDQDVDAVLACPTPDDRILAIHEALEILEAQDPLKARLVKLKYFVGLENTEIAEALEISVSTVERHWAFARAWLMRQIREKTTPERKK